ncbi:TFIIH/NER complex subunit [Phlyctochytrium planicorne]|nr:TFIIH/NER complex subunit [Phlyctochytrium planicorne]
MSSKLIPGFSDEICPVCQSDRYLNPSLKLLVSPCYHKMCENCINRLFLAGPGPCPICKQTLRKSNFVAQTFEDLYVEKEVGRKEDKPNLTNVKHGFNKRLEDFGGDLRAYNDYLEEVEELMFNLINDVDVQGTNERIEKFRQENKDLIAANLARQMNEDKMMAHRLKMEKEERKIRKEAYMVKALEAEKAKKAEQENILNQLASSDKSAKSILSESIKNKRKKPDDSDIEDVVAAALPDLELDMDDSYLMDLDDDFDPLDHEYDDPANFRILDVYNDPWTIDAHKNKRAKAEGFMPSWTYQRAIMSAFLGIDEGITNPETPP